MLVIKLDIPLKKEERQNF